MVDFSDVIIEKLVVHKVGNRGKDEGFMVSSDLANISDEVLDKHLRKYFLSAFNMDNPYRFTHDADLNLNEVYAYVKKVFAEPLCFQEQSVNILKHLYDRSTHPNIKSGEFYMVYFSNCIIEDRPYDAIGLFKSERKDNFLKVRDSHQRFQVEYQEGISVKKLDKGCVILNALEEQGYRVYVVDTTNKANETAIYWADEFLKVKEYQDQHFYTKSYIDMCTEFCQQAADEEKAYTDKKEQALFLNDTINYFAKNHEFSLQDFNTAVLKDDPEIIEEFNAYKMTYEVVNEIDSTEFFEISPAAVKQAKRQIKNLIKLDTDIEIKIKNQVSSDTGEEYIERGYDEEKRMHYYKVYFNSEE